jgi:hypothetical protein
MNKIAFIVVVVVMGCFEPIMAILVGVVGLCCYIMLGNSFVNLPLPKDDDKVGDN